MESWQNWDNLVMYIKDNLGADSNDFEYTDEQIVDKIKEHVLPRFSKFAPLLRYYIMRESDNVIRTSPTYVYQFLNFNYKILKINNVILSGSLLDMNQAYTFSQASGDITDLLISTNYAQMSQINLSVNTWRYFAPDKIEITHTPTGSVISKDFIAEVACVHDNPVTVNPDMYDYLRDLSLAEIMIFIGRIRSKFKQFSTPYGQIDLNADELIQDGKQLKLETMEALRNIPPEQYIFFLN